MVIYKRASNILDQEKNKTKLNISGHPDSVLFNEKEEKVLFDRINEIRKYFSSFNKNENYEKTLEMLSNTKTVTDDFFEKVIVNDDNKDIKKNRLELLQMFCNTYNNFIDFSKIEGV